MAALTAAELQRRRELEGAPDPFPSLSAENAEVPSSRKASTRGPSPAGTNAALDTEDAEAFPALAPSSRNPSAPPSKPGTPAPGWGAGPPRIAPPVVRLFTDTFELDQVDLSTAGKDGKRAAGLSEVFRTVSAKHKVKCEASSQPSGYTSFTLKADTQKELERGRKLLISLISPLVTVTVDAPVSTIPAIIGPKGAFLNQIRDDTGAKIDIPRRDTAAIAASAGNNGKGNVVDSDDEEEETLSITITAAGAYAREAKRQIEEVISSRTAKVTKRVKDIPPHVLTFISARTAEFESLAPDNDVTVSIVGPDVHVSGHRGAVAEVIEAIKTSIDELNASITCIKMPMPKRQHRLLTGKAAEEILNKSKCSVQVPKADSDLEEIALWARPADLPGALAAVQQAANSQHIHSYKFPGKHAQALQIFTYLSRTGFSREVSKANPGISLHAPTAKDLQKESIVIDIVGDKAACEAAAKQVKEAADKLVGATRDVEIDWLLHRAIEGKYAKKIKGFKDTQRVTIFWPAENAESSKVLIVYEPTADQKDKAASLDEVQKELLKFAKEVADVKTEVIEVDEKWHSAIKGTNGTTLNALIGSESTLAIKLGTDAAKFVPAGQTATVQTIAVRGVVSDVTRAIADIHRIVEQAKNDEIDNSYTTEFQISQEYVGRIVGAQGAAVNRLREALGIEVDFTDEDDRGNKDYKDKDKEITVKRKKGGASGGAKARVTLKGRKENVEEAKKRILAQIERLEDETVEVLKIPRQYHSALIGRGAKYVRRLEDNYAVKVTFPRESDESGERTTREQLKADEVLIKGGKKGVADAKKELLDAVEYEKENNQQIKFTVPSRSVPRILGKSGANINEIKEDTGAQIDVDKAEDSSGNLTSISVRGTKEAIAEAKAAILKIVSEVGDEITETLQIPNHFHRTIIGSRGAGLQDILDRCGATDPRAQASLCRFPRQGDTSDEVVLRGPKTIVNKIVAELKKIVEGLSDRVVLGANIPAAQHKSLIGRGGQTLEALQTKHGVQVQFPGSRSYYGLGTLDNEDELNDVESENLVKVSGPKAACEAAIKDMQASAKSAPPERERSAQYSNTNASAVTETVEVPLKYHHAISQGGQFFRNLRNYGVNVDHSVAPPRGSAPARPTAGAASARIDADEADPSQPTWELAENHADADESISTWTLKGRDQEGIDKAKEALEEAIKNAQAISHVGFLTVPDRSVFPRIIGSKGATVQRLRADSGADITVGKDDNIITLQGSEAAVLKAKELILEIINRPARGPRRDRDRDYD